MTLAPAETQRAGRGPDDEAARLYAEFGDRIYRFCLGRLRSREEAEDAVQNTFLKVCTALRKGVVPEFEGPWLYKIAHNVCLSRRLGSSRRARVETPADLDLLGERAVAYTADTDELFGLDEALAEMPANLRRPLLMREWQGMSYVEIAEAIGVSHSAVETLIFRARRHLAQALTDQVRKTGRAVASVFNLRWLFNLVKGLGGGAGGAGVAATAAGVVVAIGGGVAIDLVAHHTSASRAAVAASASATGDSSSIAAVSARRGVSPAAARSSSRTSGTSRTGIRGSLSGPRSGGPFSSAPVGSPPSSGGSASSAAAPSTGSSSAPSQTRGSGSGGAAENPPKQGPPGAGAGASPALPPAPSVPDPGGAVPPAGVPGLPPVPPLAPSPPLPPLPPPPIPAPPVITTPGTLIAEATGPLGAVVAYTVTATDAVDGTVPVTCTPASGATFSLGHTTVSCSSTDKQGNTSRASFDVQVRDTTPPALSVPADITVQTSLTTGVKVTFTVTATDLVDAAPKVACTPASGSVFLVQTTPVTCTATDSSGNSSSKSFDVTVTLVPPLG